MSIAWSIRCSSWSCCSTSSCSATSRLRAVINGSALQGALLGLLAVVVHGGLDVRARRCSASRRSLIKGLVDPGHAAPGDARGGDPPRDRAARRLHPVAPARRCRDGRRVGCSRAACRSHRSTSGSLLVPASLATVLTGFHPADDAPQGHHPGGRLPGARERHLHHGPHARSTRCRSWSRSGVLLDLFVGVFVIGIIINHINREFASLDTARLDALQGVSDGARAGPRPARSSPLVALRRAARSAGGPGSCPLGGAVHLALVALAPFAARTSARSAAGCSSIRSARLILALLSLLFFLLLALRARLSRRCDRSARTASSARACSSFLGMMTLITVSHHLGLMWVAIEATTLASAPLLYFNHNPRSLEATWKYLLIGSVGIALALLGSFFLAYAALTRGTRHVAAVRRPGARRRRSSRARGCTRPSCCSSSATARRWASRPMHTWKPDAYGEAPGAGRRAPGRRPHELRLPRAPALLPDLQRRGRGGVRPGAHDRRSGCSRWRVAGVFMARQRDFKRMLAYSSVEHMGILVLGIGIGGAAVFGALLHLINNGLTKGVLFLSAGNIHRAYGSKITDRRVGGALRRVPVSAGALPGRLLRDHRLAALRPVPERVHDPARRHRQRAVRRRRRCSWCCCSSSSSAWAPRCWRSSRASRRRRCSRTEFRDSFGTVAPDRWSCLALVLLLGLYVPPAAGRAPARRGALPGGEPMSGQPLALLRNGSRGPRDERPAARARRVSRRGDRGAAARAARSRRCSARPHGARASTCTRCSRPTTQGAARGARTTRRSETPSRR